MNVKVSIIIPSYNYGHYLEETLLNLLQMNYKHWEALVVDDGSTDFTESIVCNIAKKDQRILYLKQNNQGVSAARNEGLKYASGKYIQFLDADDFLSPSKLKYQVEFMETNPFIDISYTECHYFDSLKPNVWFPDFGMEGKEWMPIIHGKKESSLKTLVYSNFAVMSSPMLKKSFIDQHKILFDSKSSHTEDWKFWCECAFKEANFAFFNHPKAYTLIRVHGESVSQQTEVMRFGELELRNWIHHNISSLKFSNQQKQYLKQLNNARKLELIKHMIYTGPLFEMDYILKFAKYTPLKTVIIFYCKALNRKRKSIYKTNNEPNRRHHSIEFE